MANESKKDFNVMMRNNKDMPKIQIVEDEKTIKKYGGTKMFWLFCKLVEILIKLILLFLANQMNIFHTFLF